MVRCRPPGGVRSEGKPSVQTTSPLSGLPCRCGTWEARRACGHPGQRECRARAAARQQQGAAGSLAPTERPSLTNASLPLPGPRYYPNTDAVIVVVDSTDRARVSICKQELFGLLRSEHLAHAVVLVFANKADLKDGMSVAELSEALDLISIKDHNWWVGAHSTQPVLAVTARGGCSHGLRQGRPCAGWCMPAGGCWPGSAGLLF